MMEFTADARQQFNHYLRSVRTTMRGAGVSAEEIESDIREHVAAALADAPQPVSVSDLESVLLRLGTPAAWVNDHDLPAWRRVARRLHVGPEDWRLAYLTFGLTLLGLLTFPFGGFLLLLGAFILARAFFDLSGGKPDARNWLVTPAVMLMLLLLVLSLFMLPLFPVVVWGVFEDGFHGMAGLRAEDQPAFEVIRISFGYLAAAAGAWLVLLSGIIAALAPRLAQWFSPITRSFRRPHALWITALGVLLLFAGGVALFVL